MRAPEDDSIRSLVDNLFRHESGKLISVLTKTFGPKNLELAEDVVQDTLLKALEYWKFHGAPDNPSAWLFTVARNKALDVIRKEKHKKEFAEDLNALLKSEYSTEITLNHLINENEIQDEQLRMMFVCCHPSLPEEGQVALILKTLCGFSVAEIAKAFLTSEETITKRLYRAREQFRNENIRFELPLSADLPVRLESVLTAIYLVFNEGYNSSSHDLIIREDLVEESLRLTHFLISNKMTCQPNALALMALLCFHAARLHSRVDEQKRLLTLRHQDRSKWNKDLIEQGTHFLNRACEGDVASTYHVEAAIVYEHCIAPDFASTNWTKILELYDLLLQIKPNAMVALNRAVIIAELQGPTAGLAALEKIENLEVIKNYYLLPAVRGEFHFNANNKKEALRNWELAITLTSSPTEKELLLEKINKLNQVY
jgi:RNA polymerase sigma-70 factor (ECF subfamily)